MEELNKKIEDEELVGKELYEFQKKQKEKSREQERRKEKSSVSSEAPKKIGKYFLYTFVGLGLIGGLGWFVSTRPNLPSTTIQGHIEQYPPSRIGEQSIPDNIQKHILEHAESNKPGIVIQYNCQKYSCEPDLVPKLTEFVKPYDHVYLAPNNYDGKIILTKLGKREILENFDEETLKNFIDN